MLLRALFSAALARAALAQQVYAGGDASAGPPSAVSGLPAGFADSVFVAGLNAPMSMTFARDGRLFVCEKAGAVRVVTAAGVLLPAPFVQVMPSLGQDSAGRMGDGGLFSATFDPSDANSSFLYVQWLAPGDNGPGKPWVGDISRISRFSVDPANVNVALAGSEAVIFDHSQLLPGTVFHFGGSLIFGPDGMLYSSHGDYYGKEPQLLGTSLGKVSRIKKDGSIPLDNPFLGAGAVNAGRAAFIIGLRNPFVIAAVPASLAGLPKAGVKDGAILVFDVGQEAFEEINSGAAGANGGWPTDEGFATASPPLSLGSFGSYMDPLLAWDHSAQANLGGGLPASCCTTGGALYGGTAFPQQQWLGALFFTDLCGGYVAYLPSSATGPKPTTAQLFARGFNTPLGLVVGPSDGALFVISHNDGTVHRIAYAPLAAPVITMQPASARVPLGALAAFSVSVASAAPATFQWQRAAPGSAVFVNVVGGNAAAFVTPPASLAADDGARFRVSATSANGFVMSAPATLRVMNNAPPSAEFVAPAAQAVAGLAYSSASFGTYSANESFVFCGRGLDFTDARLGATPIPTANLSFNVYLRHNTHRHDFAQGVPGPCFTFTTPLEGELSPHQAYQVDLIAVDAGASVAVATAIIYPVLGSIALAASPVSSGGDGGGGSGSGSGSVLLINDSPTSLPTIFTTVAGQPITLAPAPGDVAAFAAWSDDAAAPAARVLIMPVGNTSVTLVLAPSPLTSSSSPLPSLSPTPLPSSASSDAPSSAFAGRASSGAPAQQQASAWGLLARLALAAFAAEAVRRMQAA